MKLVDFTHVAKQHVLLAQQVAGDEVSHGRVVHLRCVALEFLFFIIALRLCIQSKFNFPVIPTVTG